LLGLSNSHISTETIYDPPTTKSHNEMTQTPCGHAKTTSTNPTASQTRETTHAEKTPATQREKPPYKVVASIARTVHFTGNRGKTT
jgi:hypothetical protein